MLQASRSNADLRYQCSNYSPQFLHAVGCAGGREAAGNQFVCPCHGSYFDNTGEVQNPPAPRTLDTFAVSIVDGAVQVDTARPQQCARFAPEQLAYCILGFSALLVTELARIINEGVPGTSMPGWNATLDPAEVDQKPNAHCSNTGQPAGY